MSFDFANTVDEISIAIEVHQKKDGLIQTETVEHVFKMPTAADIDNYRKQLAQFRGRRTKTNFIQAALYLWSRCILKVSGYEGLDDKWKEFFLTDDRAKIHVQSAVDELIDVAIPSGEFEKTEKGPTCTPLSRHPRPLQV